MVRCHVLCCCHAMLQTGCCLNTAIRRPVMLQGRDRSSACQVLSKRSGVSCLAATLTIAQSPRADSSASPRPCRFVLHVFVQMRCQQRGHACLPMCCCSKMCNLDNCCAFPRPCRFVLHVCVQMPYRNSRFMLVCECAVAAAVPWVMPMGAVAAQLCRLDKNYCSPLLPCCYYFGHSA